MADKWWRDFTWRTLWKSTVCKFGTYPETCTAYCPVRKTAYLAHRAIFGKSKSNRAAFRRVLFTMRLIEKLQLAFNTCHALPLQEPSFVRSGHWSIGWNSCSQILETLLTKGNVLVCQDWMYMNLYRYGTCMIQSSGHICNHFSPTPLFNFHSCQYH